MAQGAVGAAVAASAAALMAYAVRAPSSTLLAPSVHRGARNRRAVALTFDDGPSESTPELLEVLDRYAVRATFFQCGANTRRLPEVARAVAGAGHEIGNHTETHPMLVFHSPAFILDEMERAQNSIEEIAGVRPQWFRTPYGARWFGLRAAQRRLALMGVMWTEIGLDWKRPAGQVARHIIRGAANGAIFCLHDGRELKARPDIANTIGAVRMLVPALQDRGYCFERVSEILCPRT